MAQETIDAQANTSLNINERAIRQKANQFIKQSQVRKNALTKPVLKSIARLELAGQIQEVFNQQMETRKRRADTRYIPARDLASESYGLITVANEKNRQELISAYQRIDQERQEQFDRENAEIKKRYEQFLKNVDKNLPQKGQHKDYSAYNKNFKPIARK